MTMEGCVVRVADVIAYIGRDIEDAIVVDLIKRSDLPPSIVKILGDSNDKIINTLALDVINNSYGQSFIAFSKEIYHALLELKQFNYDHIYFNPKIKTEEHKIRQIFQLLFDKYVEDIKKANYSSPVFQHFLKAMDENYITNTSIERMVTDFIAGMTDDFFNKQFKEAFFPKSFGIKVQ